MLTFFLQSIRVVFSVMFGIVYDQVFAGTPGPLLVVSNLLLLAAFIAPAFGPRRPGPIALAVFASAVAIGRVALSINQADVRYWGSLLVLAASGLYLATLLRAARPVVLPGLAAALLIDQVLRALGSTYDISLRQAWLPIQVAWSAGLVILAVWRSRQADGQGGVYAGFGWLRGLALGGILFLETSLLALPNAAARWSGWPYPLIALLLLAATLLPVTGRLRREVLPVLCRRPWARIALASVLMIALAAGYFLDGFIAAIALVLAQMAAMFELVCILDGASSRISQPGPRLALGLLFLLILNYLNAFAFTYPYALPFMRGLGWVVYLMAAALPGLSLVRQRSALKTADQPFLPPAWALAGSLIVLAAVAISAWPRPAAQIPATGPVRIATYNMHYGYDVFWHFTLEDIARTIEESGANVVALQEVDTGRMTSYGVDDALYLSRRLRMDAMYLPAVEHLTGIAVLYNGPAEGENMRLLTSLQEQTGVIRVQLRANGQPFSAYGIWMGLSDEDTLRQIREALEFTGDQGPASFGGDFNAEDESPVIEAVQQAGFQDPFTTLGIDPVPFTDPAIAPDVRIDYVWLRELRPLRAWVSDSLASDHRMVVVEVEPGR